MKAPELHKGVPARKACVTDVLCNWAITIPAYIYTFMIPKSFGHVMIPACMATSIPQKLKTDTV